MNLTTKLLSSLTKVFPDGFMGETISQASTLQNEPFSFQVAYKSEDLDGDIAPIYVQVQTDLAIDLISQYKVNYVPVTRANFKNCDEHFERKTPGLYPDMLLKRETNQRVEEVVKGVFWYDRYQEQNQQNLLCSVEDCYQSIWFTINENCTKIAPGNYLVKILFKSGNDDSLLAEETLNLKVVNASLPKQSLYYTSWFHCDCLADTFGVEIFSNEFFEIMRSFILEAAKTGMNMLLLPAFTPALDTPVGKERKTAQLVGVRVENGEYKFDFSLMKKYIEICKECGIENFEHSHFFTQWGAKHAPKIMAEVGGKTTQIFGWETDSKSKEYGAFLKAYLKALKEFLKEMNLQKNIMFHISDEPDDNNIDYYENALKQVGEELKDFMCGDALSSFKYFEEGYVKTPIVIVNSSDINKFVKECNNYWVYYTGAQLCDNGSNRIIPTTSARNRVLGVQMYVGNAKGFLHWGYNYYYDYLSHGLFNPCYNPNGYNQLAGTSFVVYPDTNGGAIPSIRMKVFYEGINDYTALQKLESLIGRSETLGFVKETLGDVSYQFCPTGEQLFQFRQKLNKKIEENI